MKEKKQVMEATDGDLSVEVGKIKYNNEFLHCTVPNCNREDLYDVQFYKESIPGIIFTGGVYCKEHLQKIYGLTWKE